jgi:hypothetical protein
VTERYNVVILDPDGFSEYYLRDVGARQAVEAAKRIVDGLPVKHGVVARVMITDEEDFCNFLWERDRGIVYPETAQP